MSRSSPPPVARLQPLAPRPWWWPLWRRLGPWRRTIESVDEGPSPTRIRRADLLGLRAAARYLKVGQRRAPSHGRWGLHDSPRRGHGLDHSDVRPYQPGDDPRRVEWRVLARTGRAYTRLYHEERERPLHLLVDFRRTMRFASRGVLKSVQAARVATLLAWSVTLDGDRVAATIITDEGRIQLPAQAGRRAVTGLIRALSEAHAAPPRATDLHTSLTPVFGDLLARVPTGAAVVPISDFHGLDEGGRRMLGALARRTDLFGCFLYDALESEPPPPGHYPVTDGQLRGRIDFIDPALRASHRERFEARATAVRSAFVDHRAFLLRLSTDHDPVDSLRHLLQARRRVRGH